MEGSLIERTKAHITVTYSADSISVGLCYPKDHLLLRAILTCPEETTTLTIVFVLLGKMVLMLKDGAELSFFGWMQACPLSGESSIYKINFSLTRGFVLSYDVQVVGLCCTECQQQLKFQCSQRQYEQAVQKLGQLNHICLMQLIYTAGIEKHQFPGTHHAELCTEHRT